MNKRLIHFRNTNDFARVEARKKAIPKQGNGVQWSSCNKGMSKPKGMMRFGFSRTVGLSNKAGILLGGATGGAVGGALGALPGAVIGTVLGAGFSSMDTVHYSTGYWNPENALPPKYFKGNFDTFTRPCDDIEIGTGKY